MAELESMHACSLESLVLREGLGYGRYESHCQLYEGCSMVWSECLSWSFCASVCSLRCVADGNGGEGGVMSLYL